MIIIDYKDDDDDEDDYEELANYENPTSSTASDTWFHERGPCLSKYAYHD